ncbi:MAG: hypothetical protein FWB76_07410 [Oscillospiraceae bacterium]|nr:hypothetical protein [Oscillospiraceae bacterium]
MLDPQDILRDEFARRGVACPFDVTFDIDASMPRDNYALRIAHCELRIVASGLRGHIFGIGRLLRKIEIQHGKATLTRDISGEYAPQKPIRGHQLGYRANNNTYDAWTPEQFHRYHLDLMLFGTNTIEHVPDEGDNISALMPMPPNELLVEVSKSCQSLDLDFGLWYPINDKQPADEALAERQRLFASLPKLDYLFIPGSDPGELAPDELFRRGESYSAAMRAVHPQATMWISAQMPHNSPQWPAQFKAELDKLPAWLDGVIMGPNHAFTTQEIRRAVPMQYDVRLYPDITHNLRCEYPVHYTRDDWHFALASTLSRESVNPRPQEFAMLHRQTRGFVRGSVSYSEGVHDDLNKMLWTDMDWFGDGISVRESVEDYVRLFLWGTERTHIVAEALLRLELNWEGDPALNAGIDSSRDVFEHHVLHDNWRSNLHLFRAQCDHIVRHNRIAELDAIAKGNYDYTRKSGREKLFPLAQLLFEQIGIQLDVEHFGGLHWERGCTLDTIDRPITDLPWLRKQKARGLLEASLQRNVVQDDEFYFSFAHHPRDVLNAQQQGEFYLNFHGDRPCNNGDYPTCTLQVFDNHTFFANLGGFAPEQDYTLRITWWRNKAGLDSPDFCMTANGHVIGEGREDAEFDLAMVGPDRDMLHTRSYHLPAAWFENGCLALDFSEPRTGVMLSEFWVVRV